jgi:uncharacterized YccA/Bax inhibitor family protein
MPVETLLTMIVTIGAVWGGFAVVLITALKKERQKSDQ